MAASNRTPADRLAIGCGIAGIVATVLFVVTNFALGDWEPPEPSATGSQVARFFDDHGAKLEWAVAMRFAFFVLLVVLLYAVWRRVASHEPLPRALSTVALVSVAWLVAVGTVANTIEATLIFDRADLATHPDVARVLSLLMNALFFAAILPHAVIIGGFSLAGRLTRTLPAPLVWLGVFQAITGLAGCIALTRTLELGPSFSATFGLSFFAFALWYFAASVLLIMRPRPVRNPPRPTNTASHTTPAARESPWVLLGVLAVGGWLVIGMPASAARLKPPTVTIVGKDFSFEMPDAIRPGWTTIDFDNQGQEEHQVQLARLHDGVTQDQFIHALIASASDNGIGALKLVRLAGGVNAIPAGTRGSAVVKLKAGNYVALCFVSGDDGIPHVAKGMIKSFTVDGAATKAAAPNAKATITARDFSFSIPKKLSGTPPIAFTNRGPESHELTLLELNPGVTIDEVKNLFLETTAPTGPPPFTEVGGVGAIAPKTTAYLNTRLPKGKYVAVCFVPDPKTGKEHVQLGMFAPFTVS